MAKQYYIAMRNSWTCVWMSRDFSSIPVMQPLTDLFTATECQWSSSISKGQQPMFQLCTSEYNMFVLLISTLILIIILKLIIGQDTTGE